ncbi:MAG: flagellar biosynthesis protein FlhF [Nitrosomonas sp.]|nr:flagellar biosynthesis protein FlhF [Nitrosomonas sp.]
MKVRRYMAATSREALRKVKSDLGAEAVILSNRKIPGGVEIMALADSEMTSLVDAHQSNQLKEDSGYMQALPSAEPAATPFAVESSAASSLRVHAVQPGVEKQPDRQFASSEKQLPESIPENIASEHFVRSLMNEIHTMRSTLEEQLATVVWGNATQRRPEKMKMLGTLLNAGFSPLLSRRLVDKLSEGLTYMQSLKQALSALEFNLQTAASDEMIQEGGIYTLLGATGVGKTTTIAKIAARSVIRHGADKVALLTIDSYRIGGHEQLRIYGRLLGLPVRNIQDADDLRLTLSELRNKHIVLIDTMGMSHRDQMVAEQIAMLVRADVNIKKMLVMSATSSGSTLDEIISAYSKYGIHGCIITKLDETASLGAALDAMIRRKLILHYVTNGQRVPEDIHPANGRYLLQQIFKAKPAETAFTLQDVEYALVMAKSNNPDEYAGHVYAGAGND